jgi:hypothetical protein
MDEPVGAPELLRIEPAGRVERVDLAGDADRQIAGVELGDRSDAVATGGEAGPEVVDADPDRCDRPDPRDDDAA